jgi:asparagine synthase (glutamine-hydrolysing)
MLAHRFQCSTPYLMCGIAGFLQPAFPEEQARHCMARMLDLIAHRGPDGEGMHLLPGGAAIGMRRLSIVDLEGGAQPIWNEDRTIGVVFNGEIYNHIELRVALEARGHRLRTQCDTEVLVHLYEDLGEAMLARLRGMFAFAILDLRARRLFLARDHFGQKPLYYYARGDAFAFASELKSLLALPFVPRETDPEALLDFATWLSLPPPRTHFRHIRKLAAGCCLTVPLDTATASEPVRYWRFELLEAPDIFDLDEGAEAIDAALAESVRMHFRADVPVGVLLSSGLDSRIVTAYARELHAEGVSTFSVGYAEAGSELEGARHTAEELGTDHRELQITGPGIGEAIERVAWHLDEPIGDPAAFAVWEVCKFAREHVKVLLSGEGADELFAGYDEKYRSQLHTLERSETIRRLLGWVPPARAPFPPTRLGRLRRRAGDSLEAEIVALRAQGFPGDQRTPRGATPEQLRRVRQREVEIGSALVRRQRDLLSTLLAFDTDWLLAESLLQKADKMSMAASIELRTPFIDLPLAALAARLDSSLKLGEDTGKIVLRACLRRKITELRYRPKKGFVLPLSRWLRGELREQVEATIFSSRSVCLGVLDRDAVRRAWDDYQARQWDGALVFYSLWLYEAWHRTVVAASASPALAR